METYQAKYYGGDAETPDVIVTIDGSSPIRYLNRYQYFFHDHSTFFTLHGGAQVRLVACWKKGSAENYLPKMEFIMEKEGFWERVKRQLTMDQMRFFFGDKTDEKELSFDVEVWTNEWRCCPQTIINLFHKELETITKRNRQIKDLKRKLVALENKKPVGA